MTERQFITNEQGERVGVLLDLAVYEQLIRGVTEDRELLTDLSEAELHVWKGIRGRKNSHVSGSWRGLKPCQR